MEGAKSAVGAIDLPTGFFIDSKVEQHIEFREMAGPEEDLLASTMAVSAKLSQLMAQCTLSIGAEKDAKKIRQLMDKMTITDRWFYLVNLRIHSLGQAYNFRTTCPACQEQDAVTFDLHGIKVVNPPKPENLYREFTTSRGTKIRWKIATGETELKIEKTTNDKKAATMALFARISEINDQPASLASVLEMSFAERAELRKHIDKEEGDLDDKYSAVCPKCAHEYEGSVELDIRNFFYL